nr:GGDEF domain-containing phosphodiesterase [Thiorhodococcus mannitoliphagus]
MVESSKDKTGAAHFAEDLIARLSEPYRLDSGAMVTVGASIGIAFYPADGETVGALLQCADTAMYAAKEQGAGTFCLYSREMGVKVRNRLELEARLTQAVRADQLEIRFQPQVRLSDGQMVGVEVLCRWYDDEFGEVPPSVFIPIAEETGLIRPLGLWLLRQACREVACWDKPEDGLVLAVNISTAQLTHDFATLIRELQSNCRASGTRLELELNEASLVQARPEVGIVLDTLSELGVTLVMDDFGSRYSSLHYLRRFSFHKLKIDRSLIENLETDEEDALMTTMLINVAHQLGLEVIAEGVETQGQRDRLAAEGCDIAQGFLFGAAVSAESMRKAVLPA